MNQMNQADLIIKNCSLLTADFEIKEGQSIVIHANKIVDIDRSECINDRYKSETILSGRGKLFMPGLIDAHMHTNQQLLRGRIQDELPMIWTRIMVPFESHLTEKDVSISAQLSCLEMVKCGTTSFVDAGGSFMHKVAETVIESGLRATITCSTMDSGHGIPENMKASVDELMKRNLGLFGDFHGTGNGRLNIWFSLRALISCSPELIFHVFETAKACETGVQAHMNEYPHEISYCLEKYKQRPFEFLESLGVLGPHFLGSHCIMLSDSEIDIIKNFDVKVVHCPISNSGKGFTRTPSLLQKGIGVGLGTDGAAHSGLSLFDQMKVFKSLMRAHWGVPMFDPVVIPARRIVEMATLGGAKAMLRDDELGTLEIGKKADMISIDLDQPHILPTHNMINTLVESVNSRDVLDVIVDGKIIMKNREVLTLDEEKIKYESQCAMKDMVQRGRI